MTSKHHYLSWDVLYNDVRNLAEKIRAQRSSWQGMMIITRGGLVPGAILAHHLNIRNIDTICIASYDDHNSQTALSLLKGVSGDGEGWLVVDDLVDSGMTIKFVRKVFPKAYFVSVYKKPLGEGLVDNFAQEVEQDTWLVFPWESSASQ